MCFNPNELCFNRKHMCFNIYICVSIYYYIEPSRNLYLPILKTTTPSSLKHKKADANMRQLFINKNYSVIVATTPAPTVRPPSRIENLVPSSIAIGAISSTVISMLSPGITISTPSGKLQIPVTSVVRK